MIYLIDFENVHEDGFHAIGRTEDRDIVYCFFTKNVARISMAALAGLRGGQVHFIEADTGKQSLDLALVSFLGYLIGTRPQEHDYEILSNDNGFQKAADFWNKHRNDVHVSIRKTVQQDPRARSGGARKASAKPPVQPTAPKAAAQPTPAKSSAQPASVPAQTPRAVTPAVPAVSEQAAPVPVASAPTSPAVENTGVQTVQAAPKRKTSSRNRNRQNRADLHSTSAAQAATETPTEAELQTAAITQQPEAVTVSEEKKTAAEAAAESLNEIQGQNSEKTEQNSEKAEKGEKRGSRQKRTGKRNATAEQKAGRHEEAGGKQTSDPMNAQSSESVTVSEEKKTAATVAEVPVVTAPAPASEEEFVPDPATLAALEAVGIDNETGRFLLTETYRNRNEKNVRQLVYLSLVKKYGQKDGLRIYNAAKKI